MKEEYPNAPSPNIFNDLRNSLSHIEGAYGCWPKSRRRYLCTETMTSNGIYHLILYYCGHRMGHIYLNADPKNPGVLVIEDFYLSHKHRSQGLGSLMLKHVLRLASQQGMESVVGSITEDDIEDNNDDGRDLAKWYRDFGFEIIPTIKPNRTAEIRYYFKHPNAKLARD